MKLPHLDAWTTARQNNAARYVDLFSEYDLNRHITVPEDESRGRHVWNQFVIRISGGQRDALRTHLSKCGVGTEIYYPVPLPEMFIPTSLYRKADALNDPDLRPTTAKEPASAK